MRKLLHLPQVKSTLLSICRQSAKCSTGLNLAHQNAHQTSHITIISSRTLGLTSQVNNEKHKGTAESQGEKKLPKPDLKKSQGLPGPTKLIAVMCLLLAAYMYPTIVKPLFGISDSDPLARLEKLKEAGMDPAKTRPSGMPEWSSPFGPRGGDGEK